MATNPRELLFEKTADPKKYFSGKRVLVMGLGLHGGGTGIVKFLAEHKAKLTITDLRTKKEIGESLHKLKGVKAQYVLGKHREEDFRNAELIIKNPAVPQKSPFLRIARKYHIPIDTDIGIFFELCPAPIIGVTGTKGKSTTASLLFSICKVAGRNTFLAGNMGVSPFEILPRIKNTDWVILELSSWQLEGLSSHKKSPHVALITNILPDHLNTYRTYGDYVRAKKYIYRFQKKNDLLFLNFDNPYTKRCRSDAPSKVIFFSRSFSLRDIPKSFGCFPYHQWVVCGKNRVKILPCKEIKLMGAHNLSNILGAVSVAYALGIPEKYIRKSIKNFRGIPSRTEIVANIKRRVFINDTAATIPDATIAALNTLVERGARRPILICGGEDKRLNYKELARTIPRFVKTLVLFPGTASEKIEKSLPVAFLRNNVKRAYTMKEAVEISWRLSRPKDIILLSPGAASFNMFKNEFDRGNKFVKTIKNLKTK